MTPDSFEALAFVLNDLLTDQTACITADGYKRLTGDDLSVPVTEGRIMIGNLAARPIAPSRSPTSAWFSLKIRPRTSRNAPPTQSVI